LLGELTFTTLEIGLRKTMDYYEIINRGLPE
jgi:hypothetical protein